MNEPSEIWHLDTTHIGRRVLVFDAVNSTNDVAASLADDPDSIGSAVVAFLQTSGRGQHGRSWLAEPGDALLISVQLGSSVEMSRPSVVTGWAAVAVAELITELLTREPILKWPNDVLLDGKKLCGILVERTAGTVVGIGLNLNQTADRFADAGLPDAASLRMFRGDVFSVADVARGLLERLNSEYQRIMNGDRNHLEVRWKRMFGLLGEECVAELHDRTQIEGRLIDLSFDAITIGATQLPPEMIQQLRASSGS